MLLNLPSYFTLTQVSTFYEYDNRNREVKRTFRSGHSVISKYTADGKRDTVIDYRGSTVNSYDSIRGMLTRVDNPDGTWLEYAYDVNRNKIASGTPWEYHLLHLRHA